jgi:hypothetical protein
MCVQKTAYLKGIAVLTILRFRGLVGPLLGELVDSKSDLDVRSKKMLRLIALDSW